MFRIIPRHSLGLDAIHLRRALRLKRNFKTRSCAREFEKVFADYIGTKYAFLVPSARQGFYILLKSMKLQPEDEVILPSYCFFAFPKIVQFLSQKPVFANIRYDTYNIDFSSVERLISKRTRVLVILHNFGQSCNMDQIKEITKTKSLTIIEDCALSCGATYNGQKTGSIGDVGIFSFAIGKTPTCFGGGMITTNRDDIADKIISVIGNFKEVKLSSLSKTYFNAFINSFMSSRRTYPFLTFPLFNLLRMVSPGIIDKLVIEDREHLNISSLNNSFNISEFQSALGLSQMYSIERAIRKRIENSETLNKGIKGINKIRKQCCIEKAKHVYSCYPIEVENRTKFLTHLLKKGIDCRSDYLSSFSGDEKIKNLPRRIIYLPNYASLTENDMNYIIKVLNKYFL